MTQQGLPAGIVPATMTVFNGQMYAVTKHFDVATGKQAFSVGRSPDMGAQGYEVAGGLQHPRFAMTRAYPHGTLVTGLVGTRRHTFARLSRPLRSLSGCPWCSLGPPCHYDWPLV